MNRFTDDPSVSKRNRRGYPPSLIFPFNSILSFSLSLFSTRGKKQTGIYVDFRVGRNNAKQEISSYSKQRPNFSIVLNPLEENIGANRCNYFWFGSVMIVGRKYCFNIGGILVCNTKYRSSVLWLRK